MKAACIIASIVSSLLFNLPVSAEIAAIKNVNLVPMTMDKVISGQTVIVVDGKISKIGPTKKVAIPPDALLIDGAGKYLMPGLADMHTHVNDAMFEYPFFNLFLANGVTTIRDLAQGSPPSILHYRREIEAGKRLGPHMLVAYTIWGNEKDIAGLVAGQRPLGYDCLKVNSFFTQAGFDTVMSETKRLGWYTLGHIPTLVGLDGVLAGGMNELSHIEELMIFDLLDIDFGAVTDNETFERALLETFHAAAKPFLNASAAEIRAAYGDRVEKTAAKFKGKDIALTTTVFIHEDTMNKLLDLEKIKAAPYAKYVAPSFWKDVADGVDKHQRMVVKGEERAWFLVYELQNMLLEELKKQGVPLVLGTDVGPTYLSLVPGFSVHDELHLIVENGFSPYEAISLATRRAGEVAGRMTGRNDFGTIETGKRADLVLLEKNPLEDVGNARDPLGVMIAGRWLSRDTLQALCAVKTEKIAGQLEAAYGQGGIEAALDRYRTITNGNFGNRYYYSAATLNQSGYDLMGGGLVDDALRVLQLNAEEYPEDWNSFDSYGEALMKAGQKQRAIESYERALALDPSQENPRTMLRELRQD